MAKGIINGIVNDFFGGLLQEGKRQMWGGHSQKKKSGGSRPVVFRSYRIQHNHYYLRRKKSPFKKLYDELKTKD